MRANAPQLPGGGGGMGAAGIEWCITFYLTTGNSWTFGSKFTEERKKRKKSFYDTGTMNPVQTNASHN